MKQASAYFHAHSDAVLKSIGCIPTPEDDCVYTLQHENESIIITKHVDDFGLLSKSKELITYVKNKLSEVYEITEDPEMKFYLGYNIKRDRMKKEMTLDQHGYITDFIEKYKIPITGQFPSTPMDYISQENKDPGKLLNEKEKTMFQSKVGTLLYLAIMTRPDILYATSIMTTKTKQPTSTDLIAVDRILLYISGTKEKGLKLASTNGVTLHATVDASYACHEDFKSHSGCTVHVGNLSGSLLTKSTKQKITADSSTAAEFIATHVVAKEILWARRFLASIGFPQKDPTVLYEDNKSTISMIENKCNGKKTKHIGVRYNLIRELHEKLVLVMKHLITVDMPSDMLTKPLAPSPFIHLRKKILGMLALIIKNSFEQLPHF